VLSLAVTGILSPGTLRSRARCTATRSPRRHQDGLLLILLPALGVALLLFLTLEHVVGAVRGRT
jgi:hypothetical protein